MARKKKNVEDSCSLDIKMEPKSEDVKPRRSSRRNAVEGAVVKVAKNKTESTSKKKLPQLSTKRNMEPETHPKMKKAKVSLKKINIKEEINSESEQSSHCSTDSGISSGLLSSVEKLKEKCPTDTNKASCSKTLCVSGNNGDSSSESEWEDVAENEEQSLEDYKPEIPKEGVEITIDCPELNVRKRKKNQFDVMDYIRLQVNRSRKEAQMSIHKTHLLCLLAHGFYINDILNSSNMKSLALSMLPSDFVSLTSGRKIDKVDRDGIERIVTWFRASFSFETKNDSFLDPSNTLVKYFETGTCLNASEYNLLFIVFARTLGLKTRLCMSFYPATYKAQNLIKKNSSNKKVKKETEIAKNVKVEEANKNGDEALNDVSKIEIMPDTKLSQDSNAQKSKLVKTPKSKLKMNKPVNKSKKETRDKAEKKSRSRRASAKRKNYKLCSDDEDDGDKDDEEYVLKDEEDFEEPKTFRKSSTKTPKKSNRKILSSDSEPSSPVAANYTPDKITCWAEVFSKPDKAWIAVECVNNRVNVPYDIECSLPKPVSYIITYDNRSYVKDVTRRYCSEYMTSTVKLRVDSEWWEETLIPFLPPNTKIDKEEEKNLEIMLINKPLPTTVSGFKNHPLYALKRHLLKFEAIYPPDAAPVGFLRSEPVYPRECVAQLHSRETWLKEARVVRIGEEPYKIVKARPKWDKMAGVLRTDLPLDVFGFWQTKPYEPPTAVGGKVPRNEYGNVELFKPSMLPKGTVHLQLPGLNRIAKKLGIDCSAAVVGFDGHKGSVHPVYDGFVICKEYKDTILAAWEEEQENARKREEEKREKRIYGNWKKLIKGLLIRERIKLKYHSN